MLTDNPAAPLILAVEDDSNHAELIQRSFEDAPEEYRMEVAGTLLTAKEAMELRPPSLVLTDYRLPDGDGSELVVMASRSWPVIMMTSHGSEKIAVEAMKIGALDYIVKSPETLENLPRTCKYALQAWALIEARRQADETVLRAKKDWERTFDAVPELIFIIDINHVITRVNKAMADRCGVTPKELIGLKCYDVVHGLENPPVRCPVTAMIQDGLAYNKEIEEKKLNGVFDVTMSPLADEEGRIFAFVHVMRDITEHRKTEELVKQRLMLRDMSPTSNMEELMQAAVDACEHLTDSSIGFFHLVDEDQQSLTLQAWSTNTLATMCTVEGCGRHYPISEAGVWVECFHSREPVVHNDYAQLPNRKGMPPGHAPVLRELTVPVIMNDKVVSILGVGNKASPYTDHDVYIVRQFVTFASEVLGRKKATIDLKESEEKHRKLSNELRVILNTSSVGICFLKNRKVIWANPAFDAIFGYEAGITQGVDTAIFYAEMTSYEYVGEKGYSTLESGATYSHETLMKRKDGSLIWCNIVGQAVTPGNMDDGSIWVVMDTTERKYAEEERQKLELQFQQAQKLESLGVLSGGIAHDFNNILTIILGHCYILKDCIDSDSERDSHVRMIESAANRAADLCRQMLAYAGKSPLLQTEFSMWMLVDEIVKMLSSAIKKNVTISSNMMSDMPMIVGDSSQIQQVVMNLIINAGEAIGDNPGTISVGLKKISIVPAREEIDYFGTRILPGNYACLEVSDTGCGMSDETKLRVFEPFYTTKFTGRGLGMSAILGIVKAHNGTLQMTSTSGAGTTFKVYLPLVFTQSQIEPASPVDVAELPVSQVTVLLVDDESSLLMMESTLLKSIGFTTVTAANGREAVELYKLRGNEFDLVMLDLIMPEMGGIEAYHELRKINKTVPIIICSGYGAEAATDITSTDDKASFLHKPYNPVELCKLLKEMTG
jgi:PAS domain S-box-containing protein